MLGTTVEALRKRVQRRRIYHERDKRERIVLFVDDPGGQESAGTRPAAMLGTDDEIIVRLLEHIEADRKLIAESLQIIAELTRLIERLAPRPDPHGE